MAPNISVREYFKWEHEEPTEPTSTMVLTSAANRFIDVRIAKPHGETTATDPGVLPQSRLEWAFAGTSSSEFQDRADGGSVVHSVWRHWIDSREPDAEAVRDEGDMYPRADGRTLERGTSAHPTTGEPTGYEEMWRDVPSESMGGAHGDEKVCTVLQLENDAEDARGMVVRVGQFCQGILRVGDGITIERWQWVRDGGSLNLEAGEQIGSQVKASRWTRVDRIGDLWLPCGATTEDVNGGLVEGKEIRYGEFVWKVIEHSTF